MAFSVMLRGKELNVSTLCPLVSWSAGLLTIYTNHADEKLEHKHKTIIFDVVGESLHHLK